MKRQAASVFVLLVAGAIACTPISAEAKKSWKYHMNWPVQGKITAQLKLLDMELRHTGIDIAVPQGTPVKAAAKGKVVRVKHGKKGRLSFVRIRHRKEVLTTYMHLNQINVTVGKKVKRGHVIGLSGGTPGTKGAGLSTGPHLHFEVLKNGRFKKPKRFLKKRK